MRIINNTPLKTIEKANGSEAGSPSKPMQKLAQLISEQTGNAVQVEALLSNKQGSLATLLISGVGLVDLSLKSPVDLPEGTPVRATLSFEGGTLKADIKPSVEENVGPNVNRTTEKLLTQLGLPLTKANKDAATLLIQYKIEPSADHIKQLAEGSFLASKISEMAKQNPVEELLINDKQNGVAWQTPLKKIAVDLVQMAVKVESGKEAATAIQEPLKMDSKAAEQSQGRIVLSQSEQKTSSKVEVTPTEQPLLSADETAQEDVQSPKMSSRDDGKTALKAELREAKELLTQLDPKKILSLIALGESLDLEQLKRLKNTFDMESGQIHLKHKLFTNILENASVLKLSTDFKMALEEWQTQSGNKLDVRALNSLTELLNRFEPKLLEQVKESLEVYQKANSMVEALPQHVAGLHIPLMLNQTESQLELYVQKRSGRQQSDAFKMLIALNTENFEQVQILITDTERQLELVFKVHNEEALALFNAELESLENDLKPLLTKSLTIKTSLRFDEPTVLSVTSFMGNDIASQIDVRV